MTSAGGDSEKFSAALQRKSFHSPTPLNVFVSPLVFQQF